MTISVNGQQREVAAQSTVASLLGQLGLHPNSSVVELNHQPLLRAEFERRVLAEGDQLEIFRISAGG